MVEVMWKAISWVVCVIKVVSVRVVLHDMGVVRSEITVAVMGSVWHVSVGLMTVERSVVWYIMISTMGVKV